MTTVLQQLVVAGLGKREVNSLRALQNKVENTRGFASTTRVSEAQMRAMQAAFDIAKASGVPIDDKALAAAKALGLI